MDKRQEQWLGFRGLLPGRGPPQEALSSERLVHKSEQLLGVLDEAVRLLAGHYGRQASFHQGVLAVFLAASLLLVSLLVLQYRRLMRQNRQAQTSLRASRQRLRNIIDSAGEAIISVDEEGKVCEFNPAAERIFGRTREEMLGQGLAVLVPQQYRSRHEAGLSRFLTTRRPRLRSWQNLELQGLRSNGEVFPLEISFSCMEEAGSLTITAVVRDVTERKQARERLAALNRNLQMAAERARRLAREAEEASRAKGAFLATMSHEIRTPLNAVIGMTSLLLSTELTEEQKEFAVTVHRSGETLLSIINDILDFSKIESGRLELETSSFDLHACVEESIELAGARIPPNELELVCRIDPSVPRKVVGDGTRLRQILLNLLSNAVKFTKRGEIVLEVRARVPDLKKAGGEGRLLSFPEGDSVQEIHFSIRDTGIGIPKDRIPHLFQPFTQADSSTTRKFGGTGLGLAICKRLCEMMGGRIWVESEEGRGSDFQFTIRVGVEEEPEPIQEVNALQGKRALIVDDNEANLRFLEVQTTWWGMSPLATSSSREALEWMREGKPFDVAILDLCMPEMDGLELAEAMRRIRGSGVPILLAGSVGVREVVRERGVPADVLDGFLPKPIRPSRLRELLLRVITGKGPEDHGQEGGAPFDGTLGARHPLRILVAEDNAVNQLVIRRMLERLGYAPTIVRDGEEALDVLRRQRFDLVFMDVEMPKIDGLDATRRVRTDLPEADQPWIVAMTAHATEEYRRRCRAAGMDDYVAKPIRQVDLEAALKRCPLPRAIGISS